MCFGWVYNVYNSWLCREKREAVLQFWIFSCWFILKGFGDKVLSQEKKKWRIIFLICDFTFWISCNLPSKFSSLPQIVGTCIVVFLHSYFFQTWRIRRALKKSVINCSVTGSDLKLWPCTSRAIMPYCLHLLLACFKVSYGLQLTCL